MAANEVVTVEWRADIEQYVKKLKEAGDLTERESKQMLKHVLQDEKKKAREKKKRAQEEERAQKKSTREQKRRLKDRLESFKKFGESAQGQVGATTGRVFALGEGLAKFAGSTGPVGIAVLALAGLATAGVVAIAAISAAVVTATVKLHQFILAAEDTRKELEPLYRLGALTLIPPDQVKALKAYSGTWKALKKVFADLSVAIGANLAKDLEALGFELLTVSLFVAELGKSWLRVNSLIHESIVTVIHHPIKETAKHLRDFLFLFKPLTLVLEKTGAVSEGTFDRISDAIGHASDEVRDLISDGVAGITDKAADAFHELTPSLDKARAQATILTVSMLALSGSNKILEKDVSGANKSLEEQAKALAGLWQRVGRVADATQGLIGTFDSFSEKAEDALATPIQKIQNRLAKDFEAFDKARQALADQESKLERSLDALADRGADTSLLQKQLDDTRDRLASFEQTRVQMVQAASDQIAQIRDKEANAFQESFYQSTNNIIAAASQLGQFADMQAKTAKDGTAAQKRAAVASFAINKATAMAGITMSTAQAVAKALAGAAPPFNIINAAAMAAAGAAQLATVASTQPTFHSGGQIGASRHAPDEVTIRAKSGEGVLTSTGMRSIGGREGLAAANRGAGPSSEMVVVQQFQHRVLNAAVQDNVRMVNSPLRRAIKGQKKAGHRG